MKVAHVEITQGIPQNDLAARILSGEVAVIRGCAQRVGLFEEIRAASLEGIARVAGKEVAQIIAREGFETMHQWVGAEQLPDLTDCIYAIVAKKTSGWLQRLVPQVFGAGTSFYFEREPNVRFLLPYAFSKAHREAYRQFARAHGEGKITAHGPHRDSWLDCPTNAVNVWIAVGPVRKGNGISVYPESYRLDIPRTESGTIAYDVSPGPAINFELAAGDAVIFHGDQLHASELNRTGETRHVLSFRLTMDKPRFPHGHYHHYVYSPLAGGWGKRFAELPANLAWSYLATRLGWMRRDLAAMLRKPREAAQQLTREGDRSLDAAQSLDVSDMEVGALRPISSSVCLARTDCDRIVAFARRCPHEGADLSLGTLQAGRIICPWHNVSFDLRAGKSSCAGLGDLRLYALAQKEGRVTLEE